MIGGVVMAGFPSPAQDYFDGTLDLNEHLIDDPLTTFVVKVVGDSMARAGVFDGDEIIVDRSRTPSDGSVVIAVVDGELTIRRFRLTASGPELHAEHPGHPVIRMREGQELSIWGVATRCLHRL
ncbi:MULTISPECIES: LexA family protein [unclassified Pseudoclavibacter]|uniref:LexA family protein n=1 Tax=unclassified Pseudoclavibacter TaxID=2615177 RepID=UPI00130126D1|nr:MULTISPECIES: translesion error-prone DNA polymerase V autoproteolytic subunit [unclassified Pseudoclavibacter]KAB1646228.1 translesion error-prone DNA polymerase V autoproteolytic subunit [Pseudoclavibacter sp. CFCC 14310]KAB1663610.1 translesion error-prone DNA polymerase V autoproteolytic subunit [Pseudoclavibacter sp. CFCC 13611]